MSVRSLLRCAVAFAVAAPLCALADSLNVKTGAWEMATVTVTTGMPVPAEALARMPPEQRAKLNEVFLARAGKSRTHVKKSCVTQKDLDQDRVIKSDDEGHCSRKVLSKSADKIVFEQTCEAPRASTSTLTIEAKTPESIVYSMDIVPRGAGGKVHVDINGRWLAASCAGIKDRD